jgi:hypothetical protein
VKSVLFIFIILGMKSTVLPAMEASDFYYAFASDSLEEINFNLQNLQSAEQTSQNKAFTGALLMKKACLEKKAKTKLDTFKAGHQLLEAEIAKYPDNIEYRFLRLVIQENAPAIVKYRVNINEDKQKIILGFKTLQPNIQKQIKRYCLQSKVLSTKELE